MHTLRAISRQLYQYVRCINKTTPDSIHDSIHCKGGHRPLTFRLARFIHPRWHKYARRLLRSEVSTPGENRFYRNDQKESKIVIGIRGEGGGENTLIKPSFRSIFS